MVVVAVVVERRGAKACAETPRSVYHVAEVKMKNFSVSFGSHGAAMITSWWS